MQLRRSFTIVALCSLPVALLAPVGPVGVAGTVPYSQKGAYPSGGHMLRLAYMPDPTLFEAAWVQNDTLVHLTTTVLAETSQSDTVAESALLANHNATTLLHPNAAKKPTVVKGFGDVPKGLHIGDIVQTWPTVTGLVGHTRLGGVVVPNNPVGTYTVLRDGKKLTFTVDSHPTTLDLAHTDWGQPQVSADTAGESAGLVYTLEQIDRASPGDLFEGTVGVSGAVDKDGNVLGVAGLGLKIRAAAQADAHTVLIPDTLAVEEHRDAAEAGEETGVKVVTVGTVKQAVQVLCGMGGTDRVCASR